MSMRSSFSRSTRSLLASLTVLASTGVLHAETEPATLPQEHPYQVVLRDYLATLTEDDFAIGVEPIAFDPDWVADEEDLHRLWLALGFHHQNHRLASPEGLLISADQFTLDHIEGGEHIRMRAGHRGSMGDRSFYVWPSDTIWWTTWDYPGNPYFEHPSVRNRAFVLAAVDMIMLDHYGHEHSPSGYLRRADFLGGNLIWLTYTYLHARAHLPPEVREAYETGLMKFLDRLEAFGPRGAVDNMDMKTLVSMAYMSRIFEDPATQERIRGIVQRTLDLIHSAGMCRDAGGLDASYSGIALVHIIWAAQVSHWPELIEAVDRMHLLKAHLTLPEPDGETYFGPSHFNTRTGFSAPNDQWSQPYRDAAAAMLSENALFLMAGGRGGRSPRDGFPPVEEMKTSIERSLERLERAFQPSENRFERWNAAWWSGRINYAHDHYRDGFHQELIRLHEQEDPRLQSPYLRESAEFIEIFPQSDWSLTREEDADTFLTARLGDYAAIVYTGPLGGTGYMNFAGGGLSAFWTPDAGAVILGRTGHPVQPDRTQQTWEHWRLWPTHALSGETADGQPFSSARLRRRVSEVTYRVDSESAWVTIAGPLGSRHDDARTAPRDALTGEVSYRRDIGIDRGGVTVETRLYADGGDQVRELYEILPLFLEDTFRQRNIEVFHAVEVFDGESWEPATTEARDHIQAVRVRRFEGGALIEFDRPQRVSLSPEIWSDTYQSRVTARNLLIHLLEHGAEASSPLPEVSVRYRIRPLDTTENADRWDFEDAADGEPSLQRQRQAILAALHRGEAEAAILRAGLQAPERELRMTTTRALRAAGERGVEILREALEQVDHFETRHLIRNALADVDALPPATFVLPPIALREGSLLLLETSAGAPVDLVIGHPHRFGASAQGRIEGAGSLTIDLDPEGDGWTLFGEQTYEGGTRILSGTVTALDAQSLGSGPIAIEARGTLRVRGGAPPNAMVLRGGTLELNRNTGQTLGMDGREAIQLEAPGFETMAFRVPASTHNRGDESTATRFTYGAAPLQPTGNDHLRQSGVLRLEEPGQVRTLVLEWEAPGLGSSWHLAHFDRDTEEWVPVTSGPEATGETLPASVSGDWYTWRQEQDGDLDSLLTPGTTGRDSERGVIWVVLEPGTEGEFALIAEESSP